MKTVNVKHLVLGRGRPKICVPLVAKNTAELDAAVAGLNGVPCDLVEFRADFLTDAANAEAVLAHLKILRERLPDMPVLFTFRTFAEGGECEVPSEYYFMLLHRVIASNLADMVDIELFAGDDGVQALIAAARQCGVVTLLCNHDFSATPEKEEIIRRLRLMQERGADICKIAVMPKSAADVITLMDAAETMSRCYAERPIVAIAMGRLGAVSRVAGEFFGSAMTFGTAGKASAPGQIEAAELSRILDVMTVKD